MFDFYSAICLLLIFEGLAYGLFPATMKKMMLQVLTLPEKTLQNSGLVLAAIGALFLLFRT